MKDDELEKLRNSYFEAISLLQNEEDILNSLPNPEYQSFFPLMEGLIVKLISECKEFQQLGDEADVLEEVANLKKKIAICQQRVEQVKNQVKEDSLESQSSHPKRHLIFAKTTFGSTYLERDLRDIPKEYYDKVLSTLDTLESGNITGNVEKARQLVNNKKLFGLYEVKEFKVRLIYRVLNGDMVYVTQVRMKKDNNSSIDKNELISRSRSTNNEYMELKDRVQNPIDRELLIMEHDKIRQEIIQKLTNGKKEDKGDQK